MWDNYDYDDLVEEKVFVKENGKIDMHVILQNALKIQALHPDTRIRFVKSSEAVN